MPTIIQLTDLHLMADELGELKGVCVRDITEGVIEDVRNRIGIGELDCDRIVITGDLAHDELRDTYIILRRLLGDLAPRCLLLPGNHDSRSMMRYVFPELFAPDDKFLAFSVAADNWRLIGLDSHIHGKVHGRFDSRQLDWLVQELREHVDQPTVLFMHHPPFAIGSAWINAIGLENADELMQCVTSATQVKAICAGHVHQEFESVVNGLGLFTTPSASIQITPEKEEFVLDQRPAGFRIIRLGEQFESEVVRLPH